MPKERAVRTRRRSRRGTPIEPIKFAATDKALEQRLIKERIINDVLYSLVEFPFDMCLDRGVLSSTLVDTKYITSGLYGKVYVARLKTDNGVTPKLIVKEALLKKFEKDKLMPKASYIGRTQYPNEYAIMNLVNNALYSGECPNFLITYNLGICRSCRSPLDDCYLAFMELALGDTYVLDAEFPDKIPDRVAISMLFQLLVGLYWLHSRYGIYHGDLHLGNILLLKAPRTGTTTYIINGKLYVVENVGYTFCISDFGNSKVYSPLNALTDFLGTRNAKVVGDRLVPFSSKRSTHRMISWEDGEVSTENRFSKTVDILPDIDVDLKDFHKFPAFEFMDDIQDLLNIYTGMYYYDRFSDNFKDIINEYDRENASPFPKDAMYVRADIMLDRLYKRLSNNIKPSIPNTIWEM